MSVLIAKWLVGALSIIIVADLLDAMVVSGPYIALIVALLWGLMNVSIKPLIVIITFPLNVLTFGLFTFIINGALLLFLSSFVEGLSVEGFWWAILAAAMVAVINWGGNQLINALSSEEKRS
ncbi:MAG: phage holin family protein [Candidatus Paceibacterota bacterium]